MAGIPNRLVEEYKRARLLGLVVNIALPLTGLAAILLLSPGIETNFELGEEYRILAYILILFSVVLCLMSRVLHSRLMEQVKRLLAEDLYRKGKLLISYGVIYFLLFCPTLWGFAYHFLTADVLVPGVMVLITIASYIFITPKLEGYFKAK